MNKKREKIIINTSLLGILANIFLSTIKFIIGLVSSSIAIVLDAVNNLSDALSSIITIIGTKLASKKPDKKHPYGHGRIEYLSAMTIALIILYAGVTSIIESIKKIITPQVPDYSTLSLVIIICAILVKLLLGIYVKRVAKKVNSSSLANSAQDALMDCIISFSTLLAAIIYLIFNISIESWLGLIISLIIIKSGIGMIKNTVSQVLGERIDEKIARSVKKTVMAYEQVHGVYDLFLNNYGPDNYMGSVHIEVDDTLTALEIDKLTRKITDEVYKLHNVLLVAIGIYSINTSDKEVIDIRNDICKIVYSYECVLQLHGFYIEKETKTIYFDLIIDYSNNDREEVYNRIYSDVESKYKDYNICIKLDIDASE